MKNLTLYSCTSGGLNLFIEFGTHVGSTVMKVTRKDEADLRHWIYMVIL
jgi:hypothetical protein